MNFTEAISSGFNNYVNFSGRAQRSAFWYWVLFCFLASIVCGILDYMIFGGAGIPWIQVLFGLGTLLPYLAVGARRLHDIGRTGWWLLLMFIPLIGIIVLIVWWCQRGQPGANRFGPNPLGE